MSMSDPMGDMLTRIRNGLKAGKSVINVSASKMAENVLDVLKREGYIRGYKRNNLRTGVEEITVELKYFEGQPAIKELRRVSKPGRRVYSKIRDLNYLYNGLGISILSTPNGVLSDQEARKVNVGGEIICSVY